MDNLYDVIGLLARTTPLGRKVKLESKHGDGQIKEYTVESYSKRRNEIVLSRLVAGKKVLLKLPIKIEDDHKDNSDYENTASNTPSAVFTVSGKLVYLIGAI